MPLGIKIIQSRMRYFIYLSYDGMAYHGWQIQPNGMSVQEKLQSCLSTILHTPIEIVGAGRTDAGVNATEMAAHFDCDTTFDTSDIVRKLNRFLPSDISITRIIQVRDNAHARFDALSRTYKYYLSIGKSPVLRNYSYRIPYSLDFNMMNKAASLLRLYTDFTSFSKVHTDTKTNNCKIMQAEWKRIVSHPLLLHGCNQCELWEFTIRADRFLRNMVRAIVGTLIDVGRGLMTVEKFGEIIELKNRCAAGTSVPGNALFLAGIEYGDELFVYNNESKF